jgi:hypothetical protein
MLKEALLSLILLSPPYTRMYDMSDLLYPPPTFDNAPNFSIPMGVVGSFPILTHHPKIVLLREKIRINTMIYDLADYYSIDNTKILWYDNVMILTTSSEVHKTLEVH